MPMSLIAAENEATVINLRLAFEGESRDFAKYAAFAARADAEGLHGVASLFRATAFAEQIHANNHVGVIRRLGGDATASTHVVEVKSTLENLRLALDGELHDIDSMYPELLGHSTGRNNSTTRTLNWALEAEKTHAQLIGEAIELLEAGGTKSWVSAARDFYVRRICGHVSENADGGRCWGCNYFCENFELIR